MPRVKLMIVLFGMIGSGAVFAAGPPGTVPVDTVPPFVKTVEVHPGLPFEVRVLPTPVQSGEVGNGPHRIARVEVYRRGRSKPLQTLEVTGYSTPFYLQFSRFEDANFDGYADLLIGNDGGAKWSGYQVFLYDPASGTFVENALSRELSEHLGGQELEFHRLDGEIEVSHLVFGCQSAPVTETFEVKDSHLRQVQRQDLVREKDGCYRVTRRALDGGLREIYRQRVPERDGGD
jgi:hypothetical protein